jgi:hypothetical protein
MIISLGFTNQVKFDFLPVPPPVITATKPLTENKSVAERDAMLISHKQYYGNGTSEK